ncbi:metallophosphoesterase family protein [Arcticibacter tournemirensis]
MKRRDLLKYAGLGTVALAATNSLDVFSSERKTVIKSKRVLRIAHITDIHIQPEKNAAEKFAACLRFIHSLSDRPDVIFSTGDHVMDSLDQSKERVKQQWDVWNRVVKAENSLPIHHCLGNHDCWTGPGSKNDPLGRKKFASDQLGLAKPYYSFDRNGWHFIILDSTFLDSGQGYLGKLDEQQFNWLQHDLKSLDSKTPVMVLSHIPILGVSVFFDGENEKSGMNWNVPGAWMHIDARKITDLFYQYPNVKLCIRGHIHLKDSAEYNNVSYFCNGAVCGNWWDGVYHQTPPGFALIDLFDDGTFRNQYLPYDK